MYLQNIFWLGVAIAVIYYTNFFFHLFNNPNVQPLFFEISMAGFTMSIFLVLYSAIVIPYLYGVNVEEYNPKLISIGTVTGVIAIISLLITIWPVWGWTSLLIFLALFKGFMSLAVLLPSDNLGNFYYILGTVLFILINLSAVMSFYLIEHEGYLH